jgi:hypothetical protein
MDSLTRIKRSLDHGALDHKWIARNHLHNPGYSAGTLSIPKKELHRMATSAFDYYDKYRHVFQADPSLDAITNMCSTTEHKTDVNKEDDVVFHLSNVFNQIIESSRKLHQCYDCGTNARAIFLKLIETHRGISHISHREQQRMKKEYLVKRRNLKSEIQKCHRMLREAKSDTVCIMSLAIQSFGHVWVIEKIHGGTGAQRARYHHYQTCLRSHLLLDFLEHKDYGRNPQNSLDLEEFFGDLTSILTKRGKWNDDDYKLFAKLFAFLPVSEVSKPLPGFSCTWITY